MQVLGKNIFGLQRTLNIRSDKAILKCITNKMTVDLNMLMLSAFVKNGITSNIWMGA